MEIQDEILEAVKLELERRQGKNPSYSIRAFAGDLGISGASLSQVLSRKRNLGSEISKKIISGLPISEQKQNALLSRLEASVEEKKLATKAGFLNKENFVSLEETDEYIVSNWWAYAIMTLATTRGYIGTVSYISDKLKLEEDTVQECLEILENRGIMKRNYKGEYIHTGMEFTTSHNITNTNLQKHHQSLLNIAKKKLQDLPVEERDFTFICMNADKKDLPRMKEWIKRFRRDFMNEFESEKNEDVYRLCIQLFPLTYETGEENE